MKYILVGSTHQEACNAIRASMGGKCRVHTAANVQACYDLFKSRRFDVTFVELEYLQELMRSHDLTSYKKALQHFWNVFPTAPVIVLAPQEHIRQAVDVVRAGAADYVTYPLDPVELTHVIEGTFEADRLESELDYLRSSFWQADSLDLVRTKSSAMKQALEKVMAVAPTRTTVLLTGETGTGKGVMARLIHSHSNRKDNLFVSVHCGAIPDNLVESELFGHEKGAFTGAVKRKLGKFEIAQGGTVLLDEIGTISPSVQIKLLNVLQDLAFQRVGGEENITCDARIITATNIDLKSLTDAGAFRRDLYYRLNVFPIEMPTLRNRTKDIPLLAEQFLQKLNELYTKDIRGIHTEVIDAFERYQWPGNIREMEHLIERAYILERDSVLTPGSFPIEIMARDAALAAIPVNTSLTLSEVRRKAVDDVEAHYLREVLNEHEGRMNSSAKAAGISTRQLHKLLQKYAIDKNDYKRKHNKRT